MTHSLPHSEECERAVLACVLIKPELGERVFDLLQAEMFYLERHQMLFRAYHQIYRDGVDLDIRTIQALTQASGDFEAIGGMAYILSLDLDLPDLDGFDHYVEIVRERWARREVVMKLSEATAETMSSSTDTGDIIAGIQDSMLAIESARSSSGNFRSLKDALSDLDPFTEKPGGMLGLSTGLVDLDRITMGLQRGQLIIVAGRPSMGKTSLAVGFARHQSKKGARVGFASLEDVEERIATKLLSQETRVPHQRLALGRVTQNERPKVREAMERLGAAPLYIDDAGGQTVQQICVSARRLAVKSGLDALYVDYLHLLTSAGVNESRNFEIGKISKALKALAKSLDIPVILLAQLSRGPERRADRRPELADLRDSGEVEQDADMVIFTYRQEFYEPDNPEVEGLAELIIAKNKGGQTGSVDVVFIGDTTTFCDRSRQEYP